MRWELRSTATLWSSSCTRWSPTTRMPSTWQGGVDDCQIIERLIAFYYRIALKHAKSAEGFNDEELDVPALLRDIINTQNKQIQDMQGWLERWLFIKHLKKWSQWFVDAGTARKVPNIARPLPMVVFNDSHFLNSRPSFPLSFCYLDKPSVCEFLCSTIDEPL